MDRQESIDEQSCPGGQRKNSRKKKIEKSLRFTPEVPAGGAEIPPLRSSDRWGPEVPVQTHPTKILFESKKFATIFKSLLRE